MRRILTLGLAVATYACGSPGYTGGKCGEIQLGTPLSSLPIGRVVDVAETPLSTWSSYTTDAGITYARTGKLYAGQGCAAFCAGDAGCEGCRYAFVGEPYNESSCGREGRIATCAVWAADDKVVGVWLYCLH